MVTVYQLAIKTELLKKEIIKWRKGNRNKEIQDIDRAKCNMAINQKHVMSNYCDVAAWRQIDCLRSQIERCFVEKEIH